MLVYNVEKCLALDEVLMLFKMLISCCYYPETVNYSVPKYSLTIFPIVSL